MHSVAFALRTAFTKAFLDTSRDAWMQVMDVSDYGIVALTKVAKRLVVKGDRKEIQDTGVIMEMECVGAGFR